jgi:hypothetical protein
VLSKVGRVQYVLQKFASHILDCCFAAKGIHVSTSVVWVSKIAPNPCQLVIRAVLLFKQK